MVMTMKPLLLAMTVFCFDLRCELKTPLVPTRSVDRVIAGKMKTASAIYAREFMVAGKYADGSLASGAMLVLFDPAANRFIWIYRRQEETGLPLRETEHLQKTGAANVYFGPDQILYVNLDFDGIYSVKSIETAASLDEAVSIALARANSELPAIRKAEYQGIYTATRTTVPGLNWSAFFYGDSLLSIPTAAVASFHSILKNTDGWEIVIGGHWQEKIQLDESFKVLSRSRLPPTP